MFHPRKILIFVGALLLIFGGYSAWRAAHPPLNDEQQIAANVEGIRAALEARNTGRLLNYMADDFSWNGQNKRELRSTATGAFWQWHDITANVTGLKISVNSDTATTVGKYSITFRPDQQSRAEARTGSFRLLWEKRDGQWLVIKAEGGENVNP